MQYFSFFQYASNLSFESCEDFCQEWVNFLLSYSKFVLERYQDEDLNIYRTIHSVNFNCHAYFAPKCIALLRGNNLIGPAISDLHVQIAMSSLAAATKAVRLQQGAAHIRPATRALLAEQMAHNLNAAR